MIENFFPFLKKKSKVEGQDKKIPKDAEKSPYTDEEAEKVKERLQGLGYID